MIEPGDIVEATRMGGQDRQGLPLAVPMPGRIYRITSVYEMNYGLGCTLEGMDPSPYKGYLLYVMDNPRSKRFRPMPGWYFRKAGADEEFKQWLTATLTNKSAAPSAPASTRSK